MSFGKLIETIEELNEQYLDILEDVCNIESPTDYKDGVDAVGDYFAEKARALGFSVECFRHEKAGDTQYRPEMLVVIVG